MGSFHPIRSLLLGVSELGETKSKNPFPEMRYFGSTSKKWKPTDAGLLFSLVQGSLGWQREWKLFWTQTLQDPPLLSHLFAAIPATGILLIYLFMHLFFLFSIFTRKTQLASLKRESEQRPTIAANGKIYRCKYLFLEVLKKSRIKRGARSQKYIRFATSSWLLQIRDI